MSKNLRITEISLREIANNIINGNYVVPKFQRDFVWNNSGIESLGDSIIRGYPISSLLMISAESKLKIGYSALKTDKSKITNEINNIQYLLDGQQRITSIAKIFCNMDEKKIYYFDLFSILSEFHPEDEIVLMTKGKEENNIKDLFCRNFQRPLTNEIPPTKNNNRYISAMAILSGDTYGIIDEFLNNIKDINKEKRKKYYQTLNSMIGDVPNYGVPLTTISAEADLGLICRVFEKINSTGQKLTTFDLINAKTFTSEKGNKYGGITNYIKNDLMKYHNKNKLKNIYSNFLKQESEHFLKIERIIRMLFIAHLAEENKKSLPMTNHAMLSKDPDFWFNYWDEKKQYIFDFFEWLEDEKIVKLSTHTFYEYMGAIFIYLPKLLKKNIFTNYVKRKALSIGISGSQFSKSDIESVNDLISAGKKILNSSEFDKYKYIPSITNINLDSDTVMKKLRKGTLPYNVAIHIMAYEKNGLFNSDLTNYTIKNVFDEHHIIPKQQYKGQDEEHLFNSVANITLLNPESNRYDIKGKKPKDYFEDLKSILGDDTFKYVCEQNIIPLDYLNENDYICFIMERSEKLAEYLNKYFMNK